MVISHVELYTDYKVECSGGIRLGKNDRIVLVFPMIKKLM